MTPDQRERDHWAWGWADHDASVFSLDELAELLEAMLGFPERPRLDPVPLDEVKLPEPALAVPEPIAGFTTQAPEARIRRCYGRNYQDLVRGMTGRFEHAPDLVAQPTDEAEVQQALAWATEHGVAVIPYGGGTSVVGGVEAAVGDGFPATLTLDMGRMDQVLDVDEESLLARIQAGATGPELNEQLAEHGLVLRHYPQSYEFSTLGGWIATRAGGHFATGYTHIDDLTHSARMVCPGGTLETRRVPEHGAGPDPKRFILGSEGALGVVTEAWMRVHRRPEHRAKATVHFERFEDGVAATRAIVQARLQPAGCRLLDPNEALLHQVAMDGSTVLVLGFEAPATEVEGELDKAITLCERHGGDVQSRRVTDGDEPGEGDKEDPTGERRWRQAFFDAPYLFNQLARLAVVVDTFETATTWSRFDELHHAIQARVGGVMEERCGTGFLSCRFTHVYPDGPAPYYTFLAPGEPGTQVEDWQAIKEAASDVLIEHGATITHHHAVGRVHGPWYRREVPQAWLEALAAMKKVLDPAGVMNPAVLLERP